VKLLSVEGNVLRVRGMDAIDGTPVVDIKPHSPELDG
jgi:tRNA (Thr-GGU) A37 N-methylase